MGIGANWFTDGATAVASDDAPDPFAESASTRPTIVSIDASEDELVDRLSSLLRREGRLFELGITCPLKENGDCHCSVCPISQHEDPEARLHRLCQVGREQELVETTILAKRRLEVEAAAVAA
jgi:hypothetical protein